MSSADVLVLYISSNAPWDADAGTSAGTKIVETVTGILSRSILTSELSPDSGLPLFVLLHSNEAQAVCRFTITHLYYFNQLVAVVTTSV